MIPSVVISQMPGMPGSAINQSPKPSTAMALTFIAALGRQTAVAGEVGLARHRHRVNQPSRRDLANLRAEL